MHRNGDGSETFTRNVVARYDQTQSASGTDRDKDVVSADALEQERWPPAGRARSLPFERKQAMRE